MTYPFENNPFEDYFIELRNWRREERDAYQVLCQSKTSNEEERAVWDKKYNAAKSKIKDIVEVNQIPPRTHDVYLGEIDLALERFNKEFPAPEKPKKCTHEKIAIKLRTFTDNTTHIVSQCLVCGGITEDHKKASIDDWKSLPPFDETIKREIDIEYQRWWKLKSEIIENVVGDDGRYPEFDYGQFSKEYVVKNPKPISPSECMHTSTRLTYRKYSDTHISVVLQCIVCGKHIKNIPKKEVSSVNELPRFDPHLEEEIWSEVSRWNSEYSISEENAKNQFYKDLILKINSGEITRVDKSTFGSYYLSKEWGNTRDRILQRDNNICQSCGNNAECVHHLTYDRLGKENDLDLISLCNYCHDEVHKQQDSRGLGYRLTPSEIRTLTSVRGK